VRRAGEELAAVVVLLAHPQQQVLVDLGKREDVGVVHRAGGDGVDGVEHVEQVAVGIDPRLLHAGHDLGDDPLAVGGVR
jgi:hypothetical protein